MKKLLMFMLTAIMLAISGWSQDYIDVGTQSSTGYQVPFNCYYNNSFSQSLYTADELTEIGSNAITNIAFNNTSTTETSVTLSIWMGETTQTSLTAATALTESDVELVFQGDVSVGAGWFNIELDEAYSYSGGNLVIIVKKNNEYVYPYPSFAVTSITGKCIQNYNDNTIYDFNNLSSLSTYSYRPVVRLYYEEAGCPKAKNLAISEITEESALLSWVGNEAISSYKVEIKPAFDEDAEWEEVEITSDTSSELTGLENSTMYAVRVYSECDGEYTQYREITFSTTSVPLATPAEINFAEDAGAWTLINGTCTNKWYIGAPTGYEDVSLFVSNNGTAPTYSDGSVSNVVAERIVQLNDADSIHVEFDFAGAGEGSYDYIKVFLMPADSTLSASNTSNPMYYNSTTYSTMAVNFSEVKSLTTNANNPYTLNLTNNYQVIRASGNVANPVAQSETGLAKLVFTWRNDGSAGTATPSAVINNIYIAPINCPAVSWTANAGSTTVDIEIESTFNQVLLQYKNADDQEAEWEEVTITESPFTLENLLPSTNYILKVINVCDDEVVSFASTKNVTTTQIPAAIPYAHDFNDEEENNMWTLTSLDPENHWAIGTGTSASNDEEDMAMYISNDTEGTYAASSTTGFIYAYRLIDFGEEPVTARIELDAKCSGYHDAAAGLMYSAAIFYLCDPDELTTTAFIPNTARLGYVNSTDDWTHMTFEKQNISGVKVLACMTWGYSYNESALLVPAAIDNISVVASACTGVNTMNASINEDDNVVVTWTTDNGEEEDGDFVVRYRAGISEDLPQTYLPAQGTSLEITDMESATRYFFYVARVCGDDTSAFRGPAILVTPCSSISELPYTCDFEGDLDGSNPLPYCWTRTSGSSTYPNVIENETYANSETHSLYFSGSNLVVLPKINVSTISIGDLELAFSCYDNSTTAKTFTLGAISDTSDMTTFTPIDSYTFTGTNSGTYSENIVMSLTGYEGEAEYIALRLNSGSAYIDDVILREVGECSPVASLTVQSEETTDDITIGWGGHSNSGYLVRYRSTANTEWTTAEVTTNSITLSDLNPATTYIVEVAPNCEEDIVYRSISFTTPCAIITEFPWTENFENPWVEGTNGENAPNCWLAFDINDDGDAWSLSGSSPSPINGSSSAILYTDYNSANNDWLVSPVFALTGNQMVSFFARNYSTTTSETDEVSVWISDEDLEDITAPTTATDPLAGFTQIFQTSIPTGPAALYEVSMEGYSGNRRIAFVRRNSPADGWYLVLDDIRVENLPACTRPTVTEVVPTSDGATITWTSTGENFIVYYRTAGSTEEYLQSTDFVATEEENTYSITLEGLNSSITYEFYVSAICGTDPVVGYDNTFTTLQVAVALPYTTDFSGDEETGDRAWLFNNHTSTSYWMIGSLGTNEDDETTYGMFVTNNGTTPSYAHSATRISAEKTFTTGIEGQLHLEFDVNAGGESTWDYLKVFITPATWTFPASTSEATYSSYSYSGNAAEGIYVLNFADYASQSTYTSASTYPYRYNLTNGTVHIAQDIYNPNPNGDVKITFMWRNDGSGGTPTGATISDFSLSAVACSAPAFVHVSDVAGRTATVTLPEGGDFVLEYKAATDEDWTEASLTDNVAELTGLTPETSYSLRVASLCEDDEISSYTTATFTTTVACPAPVITVSAVTENSAAISYTGAAEEYELKYKATGDEDWTTETITENPYTLDNLTPSTTYTLELRANCGEEDGMSSAGTASFTTACVAVTSFPYTESFEGNSLGCWTSELVQNTYNWTVGTEINEENAPDGSYCATFFPSGRNRAARLVSPIFDMSSLSNPQLIFSHIQPVWSGDQDTLGLYYRTSAEEEWTYITSWNYAIDNWTAEEILLPMASTTYQIMFLGFSDYGWGIGIDNIVINEAPACATPSALTTVGTTETTAILSWVGTSEDYVVYYKTINETEYSSVEATLDEENHFELSGLTASTSYSWYVAAVCEDGSVANSPNVLTFTTACSVAIVTNATPYHEGFEAGLGCWVSNGLSSYSAEWTTDTEDYDENQAIEGSYFAVLYLEDNDSYNHTQLISPIFDLTSVDNPTLTFSHIQEAWGSDQDTLGLYYRTSASGEWTYITSWNSSITTWQEETITLPEPSAEYQLMFLGAVHYGYGIDIDDITISGNGETPEPIQPTVVTNAATSITQTSAVLNGEITSLGNQTITARGFEWKLATATDYTTVSATGTTMTATLTGLTANTTYTYKAFATTALGTVYGSELTFTTLEQGEEPCTPTSSSITATICAGESYEFNGQTYTATGTYTATLENAAGCDSVVTLTLTVRPANTPIEETVTLNNNELPYEYQGQEYTAFGTYQMTGEDEYGCPQEYVLTLVHNSGINEVESEYSIALYPNPTTSNATLSVKGLNEEATVIVTDQAGRVISTTTLALGQETMEVETSKLASGVYYIRIQTANSVRTEKLIRK